MGLADVKHVVRGHTLFGRASAVLAVLTLASALGQAKNSVAEACSGPHGMLPAGRYFAGFERKVGDKLQCPRPAAAVVAGVFADAPSAEARLRSLASSQLAIGYPWAVHTAYLGLNVHTPGIAIVVGMFRTLEAARAFRASLDVQPPLSVVEVLDEKAANEAWEEAHDKPIYVVQLDGAERVPAYRAQDVQAASRGMSPVDTFDARLARRIHRIAPRCTLQRIALFLASEKDLELDGVPYRAFAPVKCEGEQLWVPWPSTRMEAVIFRAGSRYRLAQVTSVVCNSTTIDAWSYDASGRHMPRYRYANARSCGP